MTSTLVLFNKYVVRRRQCGTLGYMTRRDRAYQRPMDLQPGIIYGPVNSRRLGSSLGVNILPTGHKYCSFNCVYCQYGSTDPSTLVTRPAGDTGLPRPDEVEQALSAALRKYPGVSYITFSGNGEATMHPQFTEVVDVVVSCRDRMSRESETAILSNSTGLLFPAAKEAILKLDAPFMKLDAGSRRLFQRINRADKSIEFDDIVQALIEFDHPNLVIQAIFFDGDPSNLVDRNVENWASLIGEIRPREVHIYTTERPVAESKIEPISLGRLNEIADRAQTISGVRVVPFHN